jgi:hypothetical protein
MSYFLSGCHAAPAIACTNLDLPSTADTGHPTWTVDCFPTTWGCPDLREPRMQTGLQSSGMVDHSAPLPTLAKLQQAL